MSQPEACSIAYEHERHSQIMHMTRRKSGVSMWAQNSSLRSYGANIVAIDI